MKIFWLIEVSALRGSKKDQLYRKPHIFGILNSVKFWNRKPASHHKQNFSRYKYRYDQKSIPETHAGRYHRNRIENYWDSFRQKKLGSALQSARLFRLWLKNYWIWFWKFLTRFNFPNYRQHRNVQTAIRIANRNWSQNALWCGLRSTTMKDKYG